MRVQQIAFILGGLILAAAARNGARLQAETVVTPPAERSLRAAESQLQPSAGSPTTAAVEPAAWTIGPKQVLVIRVDFSDAPGEPVARDAAAATMNEPVRTFFERASYGQTSIVGTVTDRVYRMRDTRATYTSDVARIRLHDEALAAAGADYAIGKYDRWIVVFPTIQFTFASGLIDTSVAEIGGPRIWLSGSAFVFGTISRLLGLTFGLRHANLWQVTDGNPISDTGGTVESGDPFDLMGAGSTADNDFNPWYKYSLSWLPESAIATVTESRVYRLYRFDSRNASLNNALALRVFRDGIRTYWLGYRASAPAAPVEGVHVIWGFNNRQQSQLLDLTTPGVSAQDAALRIGATFTEPVYGISFKPLARGGSDPDQYIDIEVTVPAAPPNVIAAWGNQYSSFFTNPPPVTRVPAGLINVRDFAAGQAHALALKSDGTVVAWGRNTSGEATVPAGLKDVVAVAANWNLSGAVLRDGTIRVWGESRDGVTNPPAGLNNVRQLALGWRHALALKSDGTVVAWGDPTFFDTRVPAGLKPVAAVAAGNGTSIALHTDGTFTQWGQVWGESFDTLGLKSEPIPVGAVGLAAISTWEGHVLALTKDGHVRAWGYNGLGQCDVPFGLKDVVAVAAGWRHSLALKADGTIVGWGDAYYDQLSVPPGMPKPQAIYASLDSSFALVGSRVYITTQPASKSVVAGAATTLSVSVAAVNQVTYQWRKDGVALSGQTGATLALSQFQSRDAGIYDVVVTDGSYPTISYSARLTLVAPLEITTQPQSQSVAIGALVSLRVGVAGGGTGPLTYLWRRDGAPIAITSTLTFVAAPVGEAEYDVTISDGFSTVTSAKARITVVPVSRIANLSIRTQAGSGAQALVVGYVVGGAGTSGNKQLLIRAMGPSLSSFGVADALADPKLELFQDSLKVAENDNWSGIAEIAAFSARIGAFPFASPSSRDSAIVLTVARGNYSAQVTGAAGESGVVLAEIYDATESATFAMSTPRLVNVSARATLARSSDVLIAGFVIAGTLSKQVLIRAVGPTLANFGVSDAASNPKLDVFDGATAHVAGNDDWSGDAAIRDAAAAVGAFGLPAASRDAALLLRVEPGSYSAHLTGGPGTALIEIYEVN